MNESIQERKEMNEALLKKKIGYLQNVYSQTLRENVRKSFNAEKEL